MNKILAIVSRVNLHLPHGWTIRAIPKMRTLKLIRALFPDATPDEVNKAYTALVQNAIEYEAGCYATTSGIQKLPSGITVDYDMSTGKVKGWWR